MHLFQNNFMISIIIVVFKSNKEILNRFLNNIDGNFNLIIVDNSNNYDFSKIKLPKKTKIIRSKNIGYGAAINIALKKCKTKFAIISNIDVYFKKNLIYYFYKFVKKVIKFSILIPNHSNQHFNKKIFETYEGEAATMFVNVKDIRKIKFDENFFLYFEEIDLFYRCKIKKLKIFKVRDIKIKHNRSSSISFNNNTEYVMKWHYMWSMFYYYKKNYNYFYALKKTYIFLIKDCIKLVIYLIMLDRYNFSIRFHRIYGLLSSILGLKSFKRP